MIAVEICVEAANAPGVREAVRVALGGGARRVELCADMAADGLTPGWGSIRAASRIFENHHLDEARPAHAQKPLLMVMVRPRGGDFCYLAAEHTQMLRQVELAARWGADGVVLGMLQAYRGKLRIAMKEMACCVGLARELGLQVTFHRAFDAVAEGDTALEQLVALGVQRVLTAGIPWGMKGTAVDGLPRLRHTLAVAQDRLEVIVAGGVKPALVPALLDGLADLPSHPPGRFSLHAYSGAQEHGKTTRTAVRRLTAAVGGGAFASSPARAPSHLPQILANLGEG